MYQNMMDTIGFVRSADPEVGAAMADELGRQRRNLELIASENLVSPAVMAAMGSILTNKYAEGYPGQALLRRLRICGCGRGTLPATAPASCLARNMPTCSPIPAHRRTWRCTLPCSKPGDTVMGMNLSEGGHLTHGSPVNLSGKYYNFVSYGVNAETPPHRLRQACTIRPCR